MVDFVLVELGCAELGVAWQLAGLPAPPPALFAARDRDPAAGVAAPGRLRALGIIDPRGALSTDLHRAMAAFAHAPVEVDLRYTAGHGGEVRAAVSRHEGRAFLAVVTGDHVRFSALPAAAGLAALVNVLPPMDPARGTQISLPVAEVDAAITAAMDSASAAAATAMNSAMNPATASTRESARPRNRARLGVGDDDTLIRELAARGIAGVDAKLFVSLVGGRRLRMAEFGVTIRDRTGRRHRGKRTVQAVDTRRGRSVRYTRGAYLVAAPADRDTFVRVLAEACEKELDGLRDRRLG